MTKIIVNWLFIKTGKEQLNNIFIHKLVSFSTMNDLKEKFQISDKDIDLVIIKIIKSAF